MTRTRFGLIFAGFVAAVALGALSIEFETGLTRSLASHRSLGEALYLHFRFFTILVNWGIAILLVTTIVAAIRQRPLPRASAFGAALVYIVVVGTTYEALLRHTGMRHNLFFFTDMIMHDIVPSFYVAFWLGFAPKEGLDWRDAVHWLAVPAAYLVVTLVAGAYGEGYPYFFVDPTKLGYGGVATSTLVFLLIFFLLGLATVLLSRVVPRGLHTAEPLLAANHQEA